ncbi:hypothetical protein [Sphingomonas aracearum]|uniref:Uncharacterized protein n=1 Tax=Sphingomonas aracearum TaxID=2283317 RepID=A0A369VXH4_9SPHN|nr:hypothetical protein [Sphingomonas aracearum]RDE06325.1 hypothetical protein DVW87_00915 [Sphingomonas aracearum]
MAYFVSFELRHHNVVGSPRLLDASKFASAGNRSLEAFRRVAILAAPVSALLWAGVFLVVR